MRGPAANPPPHVDLGVGVTPLERWRVEGVSLLVKRDDLSAPALGGNKVRALEFLLATAPAGATVLTVGATGSTHALAVATYAHRLGLRAEVITWPQEEHEVARATARATAELATVTRARSVAEAYLRAAARRARGGVRWIPTGGSVPLGALGHVRAGLELAAQLAELPAGPEPVLVAPLGSGGTVAGLMAGLAIARRPLRVVGVQVVPRLVARRGRVVRLARAAARLYGAASTESVRIDPGLLEVWRGAYGGAYGRETPASRESAAAFARAGGPLLEPTYSAKAFAVALALARRAPDQPVLFWLTFDGRWLEAGGQRPAGLPRGAMGHTAEG